MRFGHHQQMPAALFTESRAATTEKSAGHMAAPSGDFAPAGRGSNIDTMGEVCPWVRIGRRTGISHNSASWSAIQAAPDAAALPSQRLPRDRSKPRKPLWESRGVAIDVARLLGLSSGALPQILAPQTPAGLFLCN